jgi:hypothetical protein
VSSQSTLIQSSFFFSLQALRLAGVSGHGRLMNPPARNSMWRFGFPNPVNYNDNELFCGGHAGEFKLLSLIILYLIAKKNKVLGIQLFFCDSHLLTLKAV